MIPGSANPLLLKSAAAAGPVQIERSLRFNSSDSAYLSRTPSSAGNRRTWTFSCWAKRTELNTFQSLFCCIAPNLSHYLQFTFESDNCLLLYDSVATAGIALKTTQVFRDSSAWYHLVLQYNTTDATASNKVRLYVNGSEITQFSTDNRSSLTSDSSINRAEQHSISGRQPYSTNYFGGYLAEIHFIDGQALTPSSFTEVSATTGQLIPKAYTGSFGTNGFWLKFSDNSAATATTLGKDYSGNSNNWTPNNLSVTAGAGNDSLVDTPTSYGTDTGAGGEVRGNYATLNPLQLGANITLSNGNLDGSQPSGAGTSTGATGTIGLSSGKWYWETTVNTRPSGTYTAIGIASSSWRQTSNLTASDPVWIYYGFGTKQGNGSETAYGASYGVGDVAGVALDADSGTLTFYKNGVSQGTAFTGLTSGPYFPIVGKSEGACAWTWSCNFGQRPFAYTAPSGFKALCDTNLPTPVVAKSASAFDVKLYTGNGSTQTISGLGFSPDFVWIKERNSAENHQLQDIVRGATNRLFSNLTAAESADAGSLTSFNSDGFSLGSAANYNGLNDTYVAWCWDAGSSTVTNTQGSITSQVRANVSAGFSIVTYTGTGSAATVGHGLGVAPSLLIVKQRNAARPWEVYHKDLGASYYLELNVTNAKGGPYSGLWNDTAPTSTVFSILNDGGSNASGGTYVAYCFAPVSGYNSISSYVGNGSSDGVFVYTGHRTRWLMIKRTDASDSWQIMDAARSDYNVADDQLYADLSNAEASTSTRAIDFLSNGFKVRGDNSGINANGGTYVYVSFAESPFQYARAR